MAMGEGKSKLKVKTPVSLHFKTMLSLLRIICSGIQIKIVEQEAEGKKSSAEKGEETEEVKEGEKKEEEEKKEEKGEEEEDSLTKLTKREEALLERKEGSVVVEIEGLGLFEGAKEE